MNDYQKPDDNPELSSKCMKIIECDTARISKAGDTLFLIIGFNRNTIDDDGEWVEIINGVATRKAHWDYVQEHVVASGKTEEELIEDAKFYKKLCGMTMTEYLFKEYQNDQIQRAQRKP